MPVTLSMFLAGSCQQFVPDLAKLVAESEPEIELRADRVSMTGLLVEEILSGADADILLSASEQYMAQLVEAGRIEAWKPFARNRLALFVRPASRWKIQSLHDLLRDDVSVLVMPPDKDPGGAYTVELIERAGMTDRFADKRAAGQLIVAGQAGQTMQSILEDDSLDVLIAYRTLDKMLHQFEVVGLSPEFDLRDSILFTAGVVAGERPQLPAAMTVLDMLTSEPVQRMLAIHGFLPPYE